VAKRVGTRRLKYEEQLFEVVRYLLENYELDEAGEIRQITRATGIDANLLRAGFEYYSTSTNKLISAPFMKRNMPMYKQEKDFEIIRSLVLDMEKMYFKRQGIDITGKHYHYDDVHPARRTLLETSMHNVFFYNVMYGTFGGYKAMVNTADNMTTQKLIDLYAEFGQYDGISRDKFSDVAKLIPKAMCYMNKFLKVNDSKKKILWKYSHKMLASFMPTPLASAGIRPGQKNTKDDRR